MIKHAALDLMLLRGDDGNTDQSQDGKPLIMIKSSISQTIAVKLKKELLKTNYSYYSDEQVTSIIIRMQAENRAWFPKSFKDESILPGPMEPYDPKVYLNIYGLSYRYSMKLVTIVTC